MSHVKITEPGKIGKVEVSNRISLSPMEKNWCDRLGDPGQRYIDYYELRARHGVGMMNFEATYIDPRGRGNIYQLGLWRDENIEGHRHLNEAVRQHGCKTVAQINHGGRNCNTHRTGLQPVGPSNVPLGMVGGHELHALTADEIGDIAQRFRDGARRAREAGYDMISIHGAHGYLITSFLSPVFNQRTDQYGGSEENRWRFVLEVYEEIRDEVGPDMPVGIRLSAAEEIDGGYTMNSMIGLVHKLEDMGLDFVDVSTGIYESIETLIQPMDVERGCLLPLARAMKADTTIPVISAGRIADMDMAERAVASGDCDYVHMGRAFHADPQILSKTLDGRRDDIVGCIACNKCCMELFVNRPSVCTVNPSAGRERQFQVKPASSSRKIMVVGGGLAGMEAAAVAAERGHEVTLFEQTDSLGGFIHVLKAPEHRRNWGRAADDRRRRVEKAGVRVVLETKVTPDLILSEDPSAVVLATGTKPFMPAYIPGIEHDLVTNYEDVIHGRIAVGKNVLVVGGQWLGISTVEFLAEHGAQVTVVEATGALAQDLEFMAQKVALARIENSSRVSVRLDTNVEEILPNGAVLQKSGERETLDGLDQIVFALERDMERGLLDAIHRELADKIDFDLHTIGDCVWPREPHDAILEGNTAGRLV